MSDAAITRAILATSKRWKEAVEDLDVMAIAAAGVMDIDSLSRTEHMTLRLWALPYGPEEIPTVVQAYLDRCRCLAANRLDSGS